MELTGREDDHEARGNVLDGDVQHVVELAHAVVAGRHDEEAGLEVRGHVQQELREVRGRKRRQVDARRVAQLPQQPDVHAEHVARHAEHEPQRGKNAVRIGHDREAQQQLQPRV